MALFYCPTCCLSFPETECYHWSEEKEERCTVDCGSNAQGVQIHICRHCIGEAIQEDQFSLEVCCHVCVPGGKAMRTEAAYHEAWCAVTPSLEIRTSVYGPFHQKMKAAHAACSEVHVPYSEEWYEMLETFPVMDAYREWAIQKAVRR